MGVGSHTLTHPLDGLAQSGDGCSVVCPSPADAYIAAASFDAAAAAAAAGADNAAYAADAAMMLQVWELIILTCLKHQEVINAINFRLVHIMHCIFKPLPPKAHLPD